MSETERPELTERMAADAAAAATEVGTAIEAAIVEPVASTIVEPPPGSAIDRFDASFDRAWGRVLRGRPAVDRTFYLASELADFSLIWQIVAVAQGLRSEPDDEAATLRLTTALLAESLIVNQGIKRLFRRQRPDHDGPRPHNLRRPVTSSFPSGHASAAFTAAGLLADRDPKAAPLIYAAAAIVATSRVHVRIHHASDVVAGAALGIAFARIAKRYWPLPPRR